MATRQSKHIIGLTGNIGTGEEIVFRMLTKLGACGMDIEAVSRDALKIGHDGFLQVLDLFGAEVLSSNGKIERSKILKLAVANPGTLAKVDAIVQSHVERTVERSIHDAENGVIVLKGEHILGGPFEEICDSIWVTKASLPKQLTRLTNRRGFTEARAQKQISLQPAQENRLAAADVIIDTDVVTGGIWRQVARAWAQIETTLKTIPEPPAVVERVIEPVETPESAAEPAPFEWQRTYELGERLTTWRRFAIRLRLLARRFKNAWPLFAQNRLALVGVALLVIFGIMSLAHPVLMNTIWTDRVYNPVTGYDMEVMHPSLPSPKHLLGTDSLGRDILSILLAATTPTFMLGITAAVVTAILGILVGAVSAYYGGKTDVVLSYITDTFMLLPAPLFMIILGVAFRDSGPVSLGAIYGVIAGLGSAATVLRAHGLTVMVRPFIDAARVSGAGGWYIITRHLVPHMIPLAGANMMLAVTGAVVADGFIAFFGITRLYLNWGSMIYSSFTYASLFGSDAVWHELIPPALAISLFAAAFYFISRGMHTVADPRLQEL